LPNPICIPLFLIPSKCYIPTLQSLACDKDGHKEAVALLDAGICAEIVKLVKKAKQEGKKTNYIMGRMMYKMLMRPATSMVEVRACLQILANSCLRLLIECCTSYTQFAGYKKRLEEMNRLVQSLGTFRNNFKIQDSMHSSRCGRIITLNLKGADVIHKRLCITWAASTLTLPAMVVLQLVRLCRVLRPSWPSERA
jgi:hypothetical protein